MPKSKKAQPAEDHSRNISHSAFYGVHWDAKAINAVEIVARGLEENAKALGAMARLFQSQNITIEALVKVEGTTL